MYNGRSKNGYKRFSGEFKRYPFTTRPARMFVLNARITESGNFSWSLLDFLPGTPVHLRVVLQYGHPLREGNYPPLYRILNPRRNLLFSWPRLSWLYRGKIASLGTFYKRNTTGKKISTYLFLPRSQPYSSTSSLIKFPRQVERSLVEVLEVSRLFVMELSQIFFIAKIRIRHFFSRSYSSTTSN